MIKNRDSLITQFIAAACIFLAAQVDSISATINQLPVGINVIIPVGIFVGFHKVLLWLYRTIFWHKIHKKDHLHGNWVYILTTNEGARVFGHFKLLHDWENLTITDGEVWYFGSQPKENNKRGIWKSNHLSIDKKDCHIIFTMTSLTDEEEAKGVEEYRGAFDLHIFDQPVVKLEGKFRDFGDRNQYGTMVAKRLSMDLDMDLLPNYIEENIGINPITESMYKNA